MRNVSGVFLPRAKACRLRACDDAPRDTAPGVSRYTTPPRRIARQLKQLLYAQTFDLAAWETLAASDLHVRIGNAQPSSVSKQCSSHAWRVVACGTCAFTPIHQRCLKSWRCIAREDLLVHVRYGRDTARAAA
jgi:hypothetical protein